MNALKAQRFAGNGWLSGGQQDGDDQIGDRAGDVNRAVDNGRANGETPHAAGTQLGDALRAVDASRRPHRNIAVKCLFLTALGGA
jgi:hypothetical protein